MSLKTLRLEASEANRQAHVARGGEKLRRQRKAFLKVRDALAFENAVRRKAGRASSALLGVAI